MGDWFSLGAEALAIIGRILHLGVVVVIELDSCLSPVSYYSYPMASMRRRLTVPRSSLDRQGAVRAVRRGKGLFTPALTNVFLANPVLALGVRVAVCIGVNTVLLF